MGEDEGADEGDGVGEDEGDGVRGDEGMEEGNSVGEEEGVEEGDGVGEDDGEVWIEVGSAARMFEAGEDVGCPADEGGRGVVTTLSSKMSFCAPLTKLYKSRYSGGE